MFIPYDVFKKYVLPRLCYIDLFNLIYAQIVAPDIAKRLIEDSTVDMKFGLSTCFCSIMRLFDITSFDVSWIGHQLDPLLVMGMLYPKAPRLEESFPRMPMHDNRVYIRLIRKYRFIIYDYFPNQAQKFVGKKIFNKEQDAIARANEVATLERKVRHMRPISYMCATYSEYHEKLTRMKYVRGRLA